MSEVSGKAFDLGLLRKIIGYLKPYRVIFYLALVTTIVLGALSTVRPLLIKIAIDDYIANFDSEGLMWVTLLMVGLLLLEALIQFFFTYAANYLGQSIIRDIRIQLYEHLLKFKLAFFDKTPIGTLVTRAVSDIETIAEIFSQGLLVIFGDLFKIAVMVAVMFWAFDVKLVLIALSVVPLLFVATRWFQRAIKKTFGDVRNQVAALNAFVQEHIVGMNVVQLFNREEAEFAKFQDINDKHRKANIRSIWYFSIFLPIIEVLSAVSIGLAVWYGGVAAVQQTESWSLKRVFYGMMDWQLPPEDLFITLGDITSIIIFINMLYRPLRQLADRFNTLQMGMVASERVFKLLENNSDTETEVGNDLEEVKGKIEFKDVEFSYNPDDPILKGVSFSVEPGQTLAIVGATGAGKSTIISLLLRFYEHQKGLIAVDDTDISTVKLSELRKQFALVLQDVFLFSDTILNNITLKEEMDFAEVEKAAKIIGVDSFIKELPGGYNYDVKERGGMLSAGQRQLLAFLRAYVTNPSVLILDEATSSIDHHTEELIQNAIDVLTKDRTSVIIAHRLATIQKADKIVVLESGNVVEEGTHEELLNAKGAYHTLYEMQFSKQEE
ncbi:MAG: ABC transporter ATP-binding protein [Schleiferiaceae bacterium]